MITAMFVIAIFTLVLFVLTIVCAVICAYGLDAAFYRHPRRACDHRVLDRHSLMADTQPDLDNLDSYDLGLKHARDKVPYSPGNAANKEFYLLGYEDGMRY